MKANWCQICRAPSYVHVDSHCNTRVVCGYIPCQLEGPCGETEDEAIKKWNLLRGPASEPEQKPEQMNVRLRVAALTLAEVWSEHSEYFSEEEMSAMCLKMADALIKSERETREVAK